VTRRDVLCSVVTSDVIVDLPNRALCEDNLNNIPESESDCGFDPCPMWSTNPWSEVILCRLGG